LRKKFKPPTFLEKQYTKVGMMCGGTGITPIYQILQAAHFNKDIIEFTLIFGNKTTKDILLQNELDEIAASKNFKFNLYFLIDKIEPEWKGLVGYVNKDMISTYMPSPSSETLMLLCGPPIMCEKAKEIFIDLAHDKENIFEF
jgi:cytochrome-b5 reductase